MHVGGSTLVFATLAIVGGEAACAGRVVTADDAADESENVNPCADVREPIGDGPFWLQVKPRAGACIVFDPSAGMNAELRKKAELVLAPADYFLPLDEGTTAVDVVACGDGPDARLRTTSAGSTWTIAKRVILGRERIEGTLDTAMVDQDGDAWTHRLVLDGFTDDLAEGLVLDEGAWPSGAATTLQRTLLREGPDAGVVEVRGLSSCTQPVNADERHVVEIARGAVVVDLALLAPNVEVVVARGELDATPFEANTYWNTLARVGDDFSRDVLVAFTPPIGQACALRISRMRTRSGDPYHVQALIVECDGAQHIVEVQSHEYSSLVP